MLHNNLKVGLATLLESINNYFLKVNYIHYNHKVWKQLQAVEMFQITLLKTPYRTTSNCPIGDLTIFAQKNKTIKYSSARTIYY